LQAARQALRLGQFDEALRLAGQAGESPAQFQMLARILITRRTADDLARAQVLLRKWAARQAGNPAPLLRLFEIYLHDCDYQKAGEVLQQARSLSPDTATLHYYTGILLQLRGRLTDALDAYAKAIVISKASSEAPFLAGSSALAVAAAMQMCETASGNYPGSRQIELEGMFDARQELGILEERLRAWESDSSSPDGGADSPHAADFGAGWYNLGCAELSSYTQDDRRVRMFEKAIELNPQHVNSRTNRAFSMNYSTTVTAEELFTAHRECGRWLEKQFGPPAEFGKEREDSSGPLRIGFLSSDFRNHAVAHFLLPVMEHLDRERFTIFCYYNLDAEDGNTHRAQSLAHKFRKVNSLSDKELCQAIRGDRVDILVDLNGLTQHHRVPVLAMRAAPLQITWIGYPNTTGLETVDYRIVDLITDPSPGSQQLHSEKLLYMSRCFSVYEAPADLPPVATAPFEAAGHITFGSCNTITKLNGPLLRTWSEILKQVKGSRLLLKNIALGHAGPREEIAGVFRELGIEADRLELLGLDKEQKQHMQIYRKIDIALDSFPYNGTTTTCDTLIMGVPVVALEGDVHRSRVGASQLAALGLESLVGKDENEYIDIAVKLAHDRDRLTSLRSGLRRRMENSPLMDAAAFTRELEMKLTEAWASRSCQEFVT